MSVKNTKLAIVATSCGIDSRAFSSPYRCHFQGLILAWPHFFCVLCILNEVSFPKLKKKNTGRGPSDLSPADHPYMLSSNLFVCLFVSG